MEFAAAGLAAVARMRPDPTWVPTVGVLFVRIMQAPWQNEIVFGYATKEHNGGLMHYIAIARIRNWSGEPESGGGFDCAKGDLDTETAASPIVRRLADEDDIRALVKLWDHPTSLVEWLAIVEVERGLSAQSKAMIERVVCEMGEKR